jgi:hypothetical protein
MKEWTKTRVVQSTAWNGKWVVQGWWPTAQVWADLGDPCDTRDDAYRKERDLEAEEG